MTEHKEVEPVAYMTNGDNFCYYFQGNRSWSNITDDEKSKLTPLAIWRPNTVNIPTAEYEQLKADAERLDFVQAQSEHGYGWVARKSVVDRGYRLHQDPSNIHNYTVRKAIDQAKSKK